MCIGIYTYTCVYIYIYNTTSAPPTLAAIRQARPSPFQNGPLCLPLYFTRPILYYSGLYCSIV